MVNVRKRCAHQGCSKFPSFGTEGSTKAEFCSEHKRPGMVNVRRKRCDHQGCSKFPSFGTEGSRKTEFCCEHKRPGMVDVFNKRCAYQGCFKLASYDTEGSWKREFCSEHNRAGMVDVHKKRCANRGCSKIPSYGTEGSRTTKFCKEHKRAGMVNLFSRRCACHGCSNFPSNGTEGSKKRVFCSEHERAGMVDVMGNRCAYYACSKDPLFGTEGNKETEICSEQNRAGVVDGLKKRCTSEGCVDYAVYDQDGNRRHWLLCSRHFTEGHHAGASAVEETKARQEAKEVGEGPGVQAALPNSREWPLRLKRFPRQVNKVSALVQESSPTRSPSGGTPVASRGSSDQPRAAHNLGQDDGATSREPKRCTRSGCGRDDVRDFPIDSCVAPAMPVQLFPAQGIARTDTGEGEVTGSTGITASLDRALARCDGGERDDAEDGGALITSRLAGAKRNVTTTSRQGRRHIRRSSVSDLQDLRNIASLKKGKRDAVVESNNLRDEVEELKKHVADAAVDRAHAVDEATGKADEKYTEISQTLREELGAASRVSKDSKGALEAVCEERKAVRQQIQAQVTPAASRIKAEAAKTKKVKEVFQQRMKALRAEVTATSKGWENTSGDLKQIRQERDPLHREGQTREMVDTIDPGPVDVKGEEGDADDHMGLSELK